MSHVEPSQQQQQRVARAHEHETLEMPTIRSTTTTTTTRRRPHRNMPRGLSGSGAGDGLRAWLRVAFWRKPLHLLTGEDDFPHGGGKAVDADADADAEGRGHAAPREIERTLGLFDLIMIGIGGTVGSGVFATAGLIASHYAGPGAILSWLLAGLGCVLSGLSFMELSCLIPSAGSTYAYAYHALGELPAMFAGFLLTLEYGISSAGGARSWSDKFTNWLATEWQITGPAWMKPADSTVDLYAGLLMATCVGIVLCGMQAGKVLVNVVTMTKISVVLFIIVFGFLQFDADNMTPLIPPQTTNDAGQAVFGWPGVFLGASASFFGYIGYDEVCCLAGEAKNPTRNIPRAVIGTIVGAAVLSTLATFALVGMQRYSDIDAGESYGKAFEHVGWRWAATIVSTGEVFTMPITTFIGFLAQPRVQYAMAKDGLLPEAFAKLDANGNLFQGTLLCGLCVTTIAIFVPFKVLWDFISLGILVAFNLTNASLLLVRASRLRNAPGGYDREHAHSVLIVVFLVTSFLAAFHWQKSVIAPILLSAEELLDASYYQQYMMAYGPHMAGMFSVLALACTIGMKYVEVSTEPTLLRATSRAAEHKGASAFGLRKLEVGMRRVPLTSDDEESPSCDSPSLDHAELGRLPRHRTKDKPEDRIGDKNLTATETSSSSSGSSACGSPSISDRADDFVDEDNTSLDDGANDNDDDDEGPKEHTEKTFEAPFVPFAPCIAIFFNWFLFAQMGVSSVVLIVLWLLLALAIYVTYSAHRSLANQQLRYRRVSQ